MLGFFGKIVSELCHHPVNLEDIVFIFTALFKELAYCLANEKSKSSVSSLPGKFIIQFLTVSSFKYSSKFIFCAIQMLLQCSVYNPTDLQVTTLIEAAQSHKF